MVEGYRLQDSERDVFISGNKLSILYRVVPLRKLLPPIAPKMGAVRKWVYRVVPLKWRFVPLCTPQVRIW